MYLLSDESRYSMESDESIYSVQTNGFVSGGERKSIINGKPKRKREKLDHLTNDEKIMRRKIKNRISAQSARDRKKMKMTDLQDQLAALCEERTQMLKENELLKKRNQKLERENNELRNRLNSSSDEDSIISSNRSSITRSNANKSYDGLFINSAEIIKHCPQSKRTDKIVILVRLMISVMIYPMILVMSSLISLSSMRCLRTVVQKLKPTNKQIVMSQIGVNKSSARQFWTEKRSSPTKIIYQLNSAMNLLYCQMMNQPLLCKQRIISIEMIKYLHTSIPII